MSSDSLLKRFCNELLHRYSFLSGQHLGPLEQVIRNLHGSLHGCRYHIYGSAATETSRNYASRKGRRGHRGKEAGDPRAFDPPRPLHPPREALCLKLRRWFLILKLQARIETSHKGTKTPRKTRTCRCG